MGSKQRVLQKIKTQSISSAQKKYNPKHSCNNKTLLTNRAETAVPFFYPIFLLYLIKLFLQHREIQCYKKQVNKFCIIFGLNA